MKMNKLAAGALALALGLGAVAPAVAAEHSYSQLNAEQADKLQKEAQGLREKLVKAGEAETKAKAAYDAAKAEEKAAYDAYVALVGQVYELSTIRDYVKGEKDVETAKEKFVKFARIQKETQERNLAQKAYNELDALTKVTLPSFEDLLNGTGRTTVAGLGDKDAADKVPAGAVATSAEGLLRQLKSYDDHKVSEAKIADAFDRLLVAVKDANRKYRLMNEAKAATIAAKAKLDANLKEADVYLRQFGAALVYDGSKYKVTGPEVAGHPTEAGRDLGKVASSKKVDYAALKAARDKAFETYNAAKLLLEKFPETVKSVKPALEAEVAKAANLIKKADALLAKKSAFIATAYAAEEDDAAAAEELTKALNETNDKMEELMNKNEKENKEINEKAETPVKPAEEKKEEKKEDKKANKPARKAGNNAKTGIAGVAGVAGILAAASVAYAASKRD